MSISAGGELGSVEVMCIFIGPFLNHLLAAAPMIARASAASPFGANVGAGDGAGVGDGAVVGATETAVGVAVAIGALVGGGAGVGATAVSPLTTGAGASPFGAGG